MKTDNKILFASALESGSLFVFPEPIVEDTFLSPLHKISQVQQKTRQFFIRIKKQ